MPTIGNDIVDLKAPENRGKSRNRRFLERVFTPEEQAIIQGAAEPDAILWAIWAGKEGAYKALSKQNASIPSIPKRYAVTFSEGDSQKGGRREERETDIVLTGLVNTPVGAVSFRTVWTTGYVHCLAARGASLLDSRIIVTISEMGGESDPSLGLRREIIGRLASLLNTRPSDIEIRRLRTPQGYGPPYVLVKGEPAAIDISLSHDGAYGAAAFFCPPAKEIDHYLPADSYRSSVMSLLPSTVTRVSLVS